MKANRAFTLLEVLAVTMFLAMISVYTWSYLRSSFRFQTTIEEKTAIQQTGISILSKLTDDISQAFLVESYQRLTFFKGDPSAISFSSLSHSSANPASRESDQSKITYSLEQGTFDDGETQTTVLVRKEVPYFTDFLEKDDDFEGVPLAKGVVSLDFKYSPDGTKFINDWDTQKVDTRRLPKMMKIALTIQDEKEREEFFEAVIHFPLAEDLNVQAAAAAAPGPAPGQGTQGSQGAPGTTGPQGSSPSPSPPAPNSSFPTGGGFGR